jgi:hypothetical protein
VLRIYLYMPSLTRERRLVPSSCPSVRLTARISKAATGRISVEGGFYENALKKTAAVKTGQNCPVLFLLLPATLNCLKSALFRMKW